MKQPQPRNAFYAQSGGVTAVINASAAGVIETARKHRKSYTYMNNNTFSAKFAIKLSYLLSRISRFKSSSNGSRKI